MWTTWRRNSGFDAGARDGGNIGFKSEESAMPGKRVQFDDETWQAMDAVASQQGKTFQELADEAFKDLLKSTANRSA
jgi:hypothetical protein